jgi:DNA-binding transcriptional regulator YhcF (GntR family)
MSVKVMSRVWDESAHTGSALLMLLAIADHANDDGVCWPSVETLAAKARVQARQAQNLIAQLEQSGELAVQRGRGRKNTSIYVVKISGKGAIQRDIDYAEKVQSSAEKVQSSAVKVQSSAVKGAIAIAPDPSEPSIEPSLEPLERATAAEPPAPPVATVSAALDGEPLPAAPEAAATSKSLARHPAVVVYRDTFLAYPSRAQMAQIVQHGVVNLEQWGAVVAEWCRRGYNPRNIGGMLDWYDEPDRAATNRTPGNAARPNGAPRSKVAASMDAVDQVMAMLERQGVTP